MPKELKTIERHISITHYNNAITLVFWRNHKYHTYFIGAKSAFRLTSFIWRNDIHVTVHLSAVDCISIWWSDYNKKVGI